MPSAAYPYPVAISRLSEGETSREPQNTRAIQWLLAQPGGEVVVVTPRKVFSGQSLSRLVARSDVRHVTWRGFSAVGLEGYRVIYAWPDQQRLQDLWGVSAQALVVIEWSESETLDWIADANPTQLVAGGSIAPSARPVSTTRDPLPDDVDNILEHIAMMARGYSTGLKWNEEDKLKADMMNRPERWTNVSVEQIRGRCRELEMSPNDIDTVTGFLQRIKDGRRFNVRSSYRDFAFN